MDLICSQHLVSITQTCVSCFCGVWGWDVFLMRPLEAMLKVSECSRDMFKEPGNQDARCLQSAAAGTAREGADVMIKTPENQKFTVFHFCQLRCNRSSAPFGFSVLSPSLQRCVQVSADERLW